MASEIACGDCKRVIARLQENVDPDFGVYVLCGACVRIRVVAALANPTVCEGCQELRPVRAYPIPRDNGMPLIICSECSAAKDAALSRDESLLATDEIVS